MGNSTRKDITIIGLLLIILSQIILASKTGCYLDFLQLWLPGGNQ